MGTVLKCTEGCIKDHFILIYIKLLCTTTALEIGLKKYLITLFPNKFNTYYYYALLYINNANQRF